MPRLGLRENFAQFTLQAQKKQGHVTVIDVRSASEYAEAHVDDAVHLPIEDLDSGGLSKGTAIVTVCGKGGGRSEHAAEHLRRRGFSARSLCTQGWMQWAASRRVEVQS